MPEASEIISHLETVVGEARSASPLLRLMLLALVAFCVHHRRIYTVWFAAYAGAAFLAAAVINIAFEQSTNPFIFVVLFAVGLLWGREALMLPERACFSAPRVALAVAVGLPAFFYPGFVDGVAGAVLFAPVGIIPCATTLLAAALIILCGRTLTLYTVVPTWVAAAFFGLVGVFYVGVAADWFLVAGTVLSAAAYLLSSPPARRPRRGKAPRA